MRRGQPDRATPLGQLFSDLQKLRSREGLTRAKVARATVLCGLPIVRAEAARLGRAAEQVAYHLLIATVHGLKDPAARDYLVNALALDHTPPGDGLTDRRRRYAARLDESRVRDHEDIALEEVARWLLEMTTPEVLFGNYTSETAAPPSVEWNIGQFTGPVAPDEIHPREEVAWDFLEKTTILNDQGYAIGTETRGTVRAIVDGVTGYTLHHTSNTGSVPVGLGIFRGGKPGRKHPLGPLGTYRLNIDFEQPLPQGRTLQVHWLLDLKPSPDARPVHGLAEAIEIPIRTLTLRAQFHDDCLPIQPCYYVGIPDYLPEPIGPKRPLGLQPGNLISRTWQRTEMGKVYVVAWDLTVE